jgi:hypothetical protein
MTVAKTGSVGQSEAGSKTEVVANEGYAYVLQTECVQLATVAEVALYEARNLVADLTRYYKGDEPLSVAELQAKVDEAGQCASKGIVYLQALYSVVELAKSVEDGKPPNTGDGLYL